MASRSVVVADVPALLGDLGLHFIRVRGDEVWAECPAHHDSGDSWSINTLSGLHSCFACGFRGDLPGLVSEIKGCSLLAADRIIRSHGIALMDLGDFEPYEPDSPRKTATRSFVPSAEIARFSKEIPDEHLERRRIRSSSAEDWGLRWNSDEAAWILPIRNVGGELLGWQEKGPAQVRNRPPKVPKSRTLFGAERLRRVDLLVLVESPLDAVFLEESFDLGAVASFGAVVSEDQMRLATDYGIEVVLALDNDRAGETNTARLLAAWAPRHLLSVFNYPTDAKDPGEMDLESIDWGILNRIHSFDWLENHHVPREAATVSRRSRTPHDRAKSASRGNGHGVRKNCVYYRRR